MKEKTEDFCETQRNTSSSHWRVRARTREFLKEEDATVQCPVITLVVLQSSVRRQDPAAWRCFSSQQSHAAIYYMIDQHPICNSAVFVFPQSYYYIPSAALDMATPFKSINGIAWFHNNRPGGLLNGISSEFSRLVESRQLPTRDGKIRCPSQIRCGSIADEERERKPKKRKVRC